MKLIVLIIIYCFGILFFKSCPQMFLSQILSLFFFITFAKKLLIFFQRFYPLRLSSLTIKLFNWTWVHNLTSCKFLRLDHVLVVCLGFLGFFTLFLGSCFFLVYEVFFRVFPSSIYVNIELFDNPFKYVFFFFYLFLVFFLLVYLFIVVIFFSYYINCHFNQCLTTCIF